MKSNKRKLKTIMLSMMLVAGMLLPTSSFAQNVEAETGGGLFGFGKIFGFDGQLFGENLNEEPIEEGGFSPETGGGLFGSGNRFGSNSGLFGKGGAINDNISGGITNGDFGEDAPLGSGLVILLGAGLGYVALKKREDKQ